jgi:SAM-dependent methyltransferase
VALVVYKGANFGSQREFVMLKLVAKYGRNYFARWRLRISFERYMRARLGHFFVSVDPGPVATRELVLRQAILREDEIEKKTDPDYYFLSGYYQVLDWLKRLERYNFNLRTVSAILDFGCGSARLIRHLRCIDGIRLVGTDANPETITWCAANLPGIEFHVNSLCPPLSFAENSVFDLAMASSVFTHIPLDLRDAWIQEIHRVLKPGGFLICSMHGHYHEHEMLLPEERIRLRERGRFTLEATSPAASLSSRISGLCDVFGTRGDVLQAFSSVFRVHDYLPNIQDILILEKARQD